METMNDNIIMTNLVELEIDDVTGFPWSKIDAPQLSRVTTDDTPENVIDFLCRHQTIRHLNIRVWISKAEFKKLAVGLPDLESLELGGAVGGFFAATKVATGSPPFPNLSSLYLDLRDVGKVSLESFEQFLRPRRRSSQVKEEDCRVKRLEFLGIHDCTTKLNEAEWTSSALLDTCTQTRPECEIEDTSNLELCWVE